jgi:hypothetical protein
MKRGRNNTIIIEIPGKARLIKIKRNACFAHTMTTKRKNPSLTTKSDFIV